MKENDISMTDELQKQYCSQCGYGLAPKVTDAMVEAALLAYWGTGTLQPWNLRDFSHIRRAIEAALAAAKEER